MFWIRFFLMWDSIIFVFGNVGFPSLCLCVCDKCRTCLEDF